MWSVKYLAGLFIVISPADRVHHVPPTAVPAWSSRPVGPLFAAARQQPGKCLIAK